MNNPLTTLTDKQFEALSVFYKNPAYRALDWLEESRLNLSCGVVSALETERLVEINSFGATSKVRATRLSMTLYAGRETAERKRRERAKFDALLAALRSAPELSAKTADRLFAVYSGADNATRDVLDVIAADARGVLLGEHPSSPVVEAPSKPVAPTHEELRRLVTIVYNAAVPGVTSLLPTSCMDRCEDMTIAYARDCARQVRGYHPRMLRTLLIHSLAFGAKATVGALVVIDAVIVGEAPDFRGRFWLIDLARDAWLRAPSSR